MDRDLAALQEVRDALGRAREARIAMEAVSQQDADRWAKAVVDAGRAEAVRLARMAVEETGMGHVTGKTLKNIFATEFTWEKIRDLKTAGILSRDEAKGIIEIAHPAPAGAQQAARLEVELHRASSGEGRPRRRAELTGQGVGDRLAQFGRQLEQLRGGAAEARR